MPMSEVYDLFKRGTALLEAGDFNQATIPLQKAAAIEPEKTSIREALGRAYFRSRRFEQAAVEFEAVVERAPTNDYALFCLGRALMEAGRPGGGAQAARARRLPPSRPAGLPHLPRPRAGARRSGLAAPAGRPKGPAVL
jgi:predicted Zn-dependent protease